MKNQHFDKKIDATGLKCPQPLLLVKKAVENLQTGRVVLLQATDPHTDLDLEVWCERFGHSIISHRINDGLHEFWIKKEPQ